MKVYILIAVDNHPEGGCNICEVFSDKDRAVLEKQLRQLEAQDNNRITEYILQEMSVNDEVLKFSGGNNEV